VEQKTPVSAGMAAAFLSLYSGEYLADFEALWPPQNESCTTRFMKSSTYSPAKAGPGLIQIKLNTRTEKSIVIFLHGRMELLHTQAAKGGQSLWTSMIISHQYT
jgi:hypothetical protein